MEERSHTHRYALWLLLHGEALNRLQQNIRWLAQRFCAPVFIPHLTVCSGIEAHSCSAVIAQCAEIASTIQPPVLTCTTIGTTDDFYRCLFLHVEQNKQLVALRYCVEQWANERQPWIPHISLLYATLTDEEKKSVVKELSTYGNNTVPCATLALYNTTGAVEQWYEIAQWQLGDVHTDVP